MMRTIVTGSGLALLAALLAAPAARAADKPAKAEGSKDLYAVFETSQGKIGVKLLPAEAPKTVANFVDLATGKRDFKDPLCGETRKGKYFDGTLFHRVIPGFMIQGGDQPERARTQSEVTGIHGARC